LLLSAAPFEIATSIFAVLAFAFELAIFAVVLATALILVKTMLAYIAIIEMSHIEYRRIKVFLQPVVFGEKVGDVGRGMGAKLCVIVIIKTRHRICHVFAYNNGIV
jgi:hypothetical protein